MRCTLQSGLNGGQNKKRVISVAFTVFFVIVSLLSEAFIFTRANHEHDHNGIDGTCATCTQIQNAESILKQFGMASIGSLLLLSDLFVNIVLISAIFSWIFYFTPITLKTRLNN